MSITYTIPEIYKNAGKLALFAKACYLKKKGPEARRLGFNPTPLNHCLI